MADIELVIKISEEEYAWVKRASRQTTPLDRFCVKAIANGIPLPKGHGRLIDADEIQFENTEFDTYGDYSIAFDAIDQADTIIEAEGSESE